MSTTSARAARRTTFSTNCCQEWFSADNAGREAERSQERRSTAWPAERCYLPGAGTDPGTHPGDCRDRNRNVSYAWTKDSPAMTSSRRTPSRRSRPRASPALRRCRESRHETAIRRQSAIPARRRGGSHRPIRRPAREAPEFTVIDLGDWDDDGLFAGQSRSDLGVGNHRCLRPTSSRPMPERSKSVETSKSPIQ